MFLCDDCHFELVGTRFKQTFHMSGSVGACEHCGKSSVCADCHCRTKHQPSDAEMDRMIDEVMAEYEREQEQKQQGKSA